MDGEEEEAVSFLQQQEEEEVEVPMEQGLKDSDTGDRNDHDHSATNYVSIEIPDTAHQISQELTKRGLIQEACQTEYQPVVTGLAMV